MSKNSIEIYNANIEITPDNVLELTKINSEYTSLTKKIKNKIEYIFNNFLDIAALLHEVKYKKLYKWVGYKDIYDYASSEFEFSRTTVKNYIQIADKCLEKKVEDDNLREGELLDRYKNYNYSQLVELLTVDELDLDKYTPEMSVRQIRENKFKDKLEKYFSEIVDIDRQDSNISKFMIMLKDDLKREFPDEKLYYDIDEGYGNCDKIYRFYLNSDLNNEFIFELNVLINWYDIIEYRVWGIGFEESDDFDYIINHVRKQFLPAVKRIIKSRRDDETDNSVETNEFDNGPTSDQTKELNEINTGSYKDFLQYSNFESQTSDNLKKIISTFFADFKFEWDNDNYIVNIFLSEDYYLKIYYYKYTYHSYHPLDSQIQLYSVETNEFIRAYDIKNIFYTIFAALNIKYDHLIKKEVTIDDEGD